MITKVINLIFARLSHCLIASKRRKVDTPKKPVSPRKPASPRVKPFSPHEPPIMKVFDVHDFPWKRTQRKHLALAKKNKMTVHLLFSLCIDLCKVMDLKEACLNDFVEQIKPSMEAYFMKKVGRLLWNEFLTRLSWRRILRLL